MKALVVLEIPDRAAEVRADGVGHREAFLTVAEHENLFLRQECGRAEREIRRVADLEVLWRLVKHAGRQKADHRSQAHADRGTQGDQARGAPTEEGSSVHELLHLLLVPKQQSLPNGRGSVPSRDRYGAIARCPRPHSNTSRSCCSRASMVMAWVGQRWAQSAQRMHFSSFLMMAPARPGGSSAADIP